MLPFSRFEIEKSLADGCLDVTDVPRVWNQKMKEYLGVEPKDDGEGCLQDMVACFLFLELFLDIESSCFVKNLG